MILMSTVSEAMSEWTKGSLGDSPKLGEQGGSWVIRKKIERGYTAVLKSTDLN